MVHSIQSLVAGGTIPTIPLDSIDNLPPAIYKHIGRTHDGESVLKTALGLSYLIFMRKPEQMIELIKASSL